MTDTIEEITLEELVDAYLKAKGIMEQMEAEKRVVQDEILNRLRVLKLDGTKTKNGYMVNRIRKTSFAGITVAQARQLGATIMEEKVDSGKLRQLHDKGVNIPGVKQIVYVDVKEAK